MEQSIEIVFSEEIKNPVLLRGTDLKQTENNSVIVRISHKDAAVVRI